MNTNNAARTPQPRLAETAEDLFKTLQELATGVVNSQYGVLPPTVRILGAGDFVVRADGRIDHLLRDGLGYTPANEWALTEFHAALKDDQARILVLTRPGPEARRVLRVLHEPRGLAFGH